MQQQTAVHIATVLAVAGVIMGIIATAICVAMVRGNGMRRETAVGILTVYWLLVISIPISICAANNPTVHRGSSRKQVRFRQHVSMVYQPGQCVPTQIISYDYDW